jgi:hypothetical protein
MFARKGYPIGGLSIYGLHIHFASTGERTFAKAFRSFRFDLQVYVGFEARLLRNKNSS